MHTVQTIRVAERQGACALSSVTCSHTITAHLRCRSAAKAHYGRHQPSLNSSLACSAKLMRSSRIRGQYLQS